MSLHLTRLPALAVFALALVSWACASTETGPSTITQDSAGITIVTNKAPAWGDTNGWTIGPEPSLEIGTVDGDPEYQLFLPTRLVRTGDGRIVVGTAEPAIRVFTATGIFQNYLGQEGNGPGEYTGTPLLAAVGADTIFAWDSRSGRAMFFDTDGQLLRQLPPRFARTVNPVYPANLTILVGQILNTSRAERTANLGFVRSWGALVTIEVETMSITDTILHYPRQEQYEASVYSGAGIGVLQYPFARSSEWALAGDRVVLGNNERFELREYDLAGNTLRIFRAPVLDAPVSAAAIDTATTLLTASRRADRTPELVDGFLAAFTPPAIRPMYSDIMLSDDGYIWLAPYDLTTSVNPLVRSDSPWFVFSPAGEWLGRVRMPTGFSPTQFGSDWVLGFFYDDMQVAFVRVYSIVKAMQQTQ